jgi:hypothetical protein
MTSSIAAAMGRREPLAQHLYLVDTVAAIAAPPKAWTELRERWDGFAEFTAAPLRERLIEAIVTGGDDVSMLRALAYAEASGERVDVVVAVRSAVYPRLVQLYSEVAATNYAKVGKEFDSAATEFTAAAKRCDPKASSDSIVGQPDPVRSGWLDAAKHAARLDSLVPILCTAAELCGISTRDDSVLLPLLIDTSNLHRRRVWEAWKADGARSGHWSALAGLGARIRAADLEGFEPYRTPKPLIRRQFPLGGPNSRGMYRTVVTDPEDPGYVPEAEQAKPRRRALAR